MSAISTQLTLTDRMSSTLYGISNALTEVLQNLDSVDTALNAGLDADVIGEAEQELDQVNRQLSEIEQNINSAEQEQNQFNNAVDAGTTSMTGLLGVAAKVFSAIGIGYAIKEAAIYMYESAAELEATEAKFETVFAGYEDIAQGIVDEFQELTPASEAATRSMLSGIQDLLVPMGFVRDEATDITGQTMTLVGALTNFNSATHSAEDVASAFTSALTGEYTSLKALGIQVSATTVQEEVLAMGLASTTDEITDQMEAQALLSLAYAQSTDALAAYNEESLDTTTRMGLLKASFTDTFAEAGQSLLPKINDFIILVNANMATLSAMTYGFSDALGFVITAASYAFELLMGIAGFMVDNWTILEPLILGVVGALGLYNGALAANLLLTKGLVVAKTSLTAVQTFLSIGFGVLSGNTAAASAAMFTYNSALLACPIPWILLIIIAVIAILYAVVAAINKVTGSTISATGIICGALAVAGAFIWNLILGVVNAVISIGIELYNLIATFANFFANVFNDPVGAIITLFSGMFDFILGIVQAAASLIDTVLGTDMASAVEGFRNTVADATAEIVGEQTVVMEKLSASDYQFEGIDYGDAWDAGYDFGEGIADTVGSMFDTDTDALADYEQSAATAAIETIAEDTGDISSAVSATEEELAYLRDLAEQEAVNRFTTSEVKIDMTGMTNRIDSDMDLDGVITTLTDGFAEALEVAAEGVHE